MRRLASQATCQDHVIFPRAGCCFFGTAPRKLTARRTRHVASHSQLQICSIGDEGKGRREQGRGICALMLGGASMTFMSSERPSRAADLRAIVRGSTASAPAYDWDGYYIGGHVGYGRGNSQITEAPLGLDTSHFDNSFGSLNGGFQFGYNFMLPSRVLLGIETDVTFPDFLDPTAWSATTASGGTLAQQIDYMGTVRGRIGQEFGNWLIYGTGGFAWMQSRFLETPGLFGNQDKIVRTRAGWTMGAGAEVPIAPHWSFKLEYLYDRFGKADALLPSGMNVGSMSDVQSVRVGTQLQTQRRSPRKHYGWNDLFRHLEPPRADHFRRPRLLRLSVALSRRQQPVGRQPGEEHLERDGVPGLSALGRR